MKRLLAKAFSPALAASAPGSLVAVTTSLSHVAHRKKYSTMAALTYQGQKWVGGANGVWHGQEYELLSFRFARGGFRGSNERYKVGWGHELMQGRKKGPVGGYTTCPIGQPAFGSYAKCVRAISAGGHRKKRAFTNKITDIVTKFHLDHCEMAAALGSQVVSVSLWK